MDAKLDSYHRPVTGGNLLRFALPTIAMTVFNTLDRKSTRLNSSHMA